MVVTPIGSEENMAPIDRGRTGPLLQSGGWPPMNRLPHGGFQETHYLWHLIQGISFGILGLGEARSD